MTITIAFTLIMAALLLRVALLHLRANRLDAKEFAALPPAVQLAVLKERLLDSPSEVQLENLGEFCRAQGYSVDTEGYRPLLAEQLRIARQENAIALDGALYEKESAFLDAVEPLEFREARAAHSRGDGDAYVHATLAGVLRYYSDARIEETLEKLVPDYAQAGDILRRYRELTELRNNCAADEKSLDHLEKSKEAWTTDIQDVLRHLEQKNAPPL